VSACIVFRTFSAFQLPQIPQDLMMQSVISLDKNDLLTNYASKELLNKVENLFVESPQPSVLSKRPRRESTESEYSGVQRNEQRDELMSLINSEREKLNKTLLDFQKSMNSTFDAIIQQIRNEDE
jgi:hypothetical protein